MVEDNESDIVIAGCAFGAAGLQNEMLVARSAEEAMNFLKDHASKTLRVELILLDLHLPRKSGLELLSEIKSDPALKDIPVIILTGSLDPSDVNAAYSAYAAAYITKPVKFTEFMKAVDRIDCLEVTHSPSIRITAKTAGKRPSRAEPRR
jgi:CheY-like chemotaxis protein